MYLVMWTHVRDYDDWKAVFDAGGEFRRDHGCTGHEIYRDGDDPNQLTVFLEFPGEEQAQGFRDAPLLKEKWRESGVDSEPRSAFVTRAEKTDYRDRRAA
jgi:hypothetical protein